MYVMIFVLLENKITTSTIMKTQYDQMVKPSDVEY